MSTAPSPRTLRLLLPLLLSAPALFCVPAATVGGGSPDVAPPDSPGAPGAPGPGTAPGDAGAEVDAGMALPRDVKLRTFLIALDGLRPTDVTPTLMPRLSALLADTECGLHGRTCAASYSEGRGVMVTETNANHVAMVTGAYPERTGIVANDGLDRASGEVVPLARPELNLAETLFDVIERERPELVTAGIFGKVKLRTLFDGTRGADGGYGPSSANPEGRPILHLPTDVVGGAALGRLPGARECVVDPATGAAQNACVMDVVLDVVAREDPDVTFINLPQIDIQSHLSGAGSAAALRAVRDADAQLGRLVDALQATGKWQSSLLIVTADHNFGDTAHPDATILLRQVFSGLQAPEPYRVVIHSGSASIFLDGLTSLEGPLTPPQQETLRQMRAALLATPGVTGAYYRLPNPLDGSAAHTLATRHPAWRLGGSARIGELLVTVDERHALAEGPTSAELLILGEHGHPSDRHVPLLLLSGAAFLRDLSVDTVGGPVDEEDDTEQNPLQSETVDLAPTLAWVYGLPLPAQAQGRVLTEVFARHPLELLAEALTP